MVMNNSGHQHCDHHFDPTDTINVPTTVTDTPMANATGMALGIPMGTASFLYEHAYGMVMLVLQLR